MLLNDEVGMLRRVPLFSGIAPAKLKLLAFTSDRVSYSAGQILFRQGDVGDAAYVILSGTAEILVDSRKADRSRSPNSSRIRSSARSPFCAMFRAQPP